MRLGPGPSGPGAPPRRAASPRRRTSSWPGRRSGARTPGAEVGERGSEGEWHDINQHVSDVITSSCFHAGYRRGGSGRPPWLLRHQSPQLGAGLGLDHLGAGGGAAELARAALCGLGFNHRRGGYTCSCAEKHAAALNEDMASAGLPPARSAAAGSLGWAAEELGKDNLRSGLEAEAHTRRVRRGGLD